MATSLPSRLIAFDVEVGAPSPVGVGLACLATGGIAGAVHHHQLTRDVKHFGRARGAMPFAFTPVSAGTSTLGWVIGLLGWYLVAATLASYVADIAAGTPARSEDVTGIASSLLLLAPLVITGTRTTARIRTVQHLAGVEGPRPSPVRGGLLTAAFPPLGSWHARRELNRAWAAYR